MNILMVHPHDIYSRKEPWTRRIRCLAKEFVKQGHNVKLAYFPLTVGSSLSRMSDGYQVISLPRTCSPLAFFKNTLRLKKLAAWADVVHFQKCHHYSAIPACIAAYLNHKPLHYDWDDWEEMIWFESCGRNPQSEFMGFSFRILERFLPLLADTVSVASQNLRDLAVRYGVKENDIYNAPVGADLEELDSNIKGDRIRKKYGIKCPLVLYIGQLHGAQYTELFVRSVSIVLHKNPGVVFMITGEGSMEKVLKELSVDLGIEDKIIFTGSVDHHEIPEYIAAADICVATFRDTNVTRSKSPLKIVEYMAMGKPVVASNVGEVRKMVGGAGILVEAGNFCLLAEGILKLLQDKALRDNLGKFALRRVRENYVWSKTASALLMAYQKNIADKN
jgi:glycosyltransferase involved in cell wall biosynthesis